MNSAATVRPKFDSPKVVKAIVLLVKLFVYASQLNCAMEPFHNIFSYKTWHNLINISFNYTYGNITFNAYENESSKLTPRILVIISVKSGFSFLIHKLLCLARYWKAEFSNLILHLDCFCTLFLLPLNSRIQFRTSIWGRGVSANKLQVMIKVFPLGQKHNLLYCDIDGVSYVTTSKVHVTSDVRVATQRLRIPKQLNCLKLQQH
jgi:hypothetical protein